MDFLKIIKLVWSNEIKDPKINKAVKNMYVTNNGSFGMKSEHIFDDSVIADLKKGKNNAKDAKG